MGNWRSRILDQLIPRIVPVSVVLDPDRLLLEEQVLKELHAEGFELISFEEPVTFRYAYESKYRSKWDRGKNTDTSVIIHVKTRDLKKVPFDLAYGPHQFSISLADVFPNLSYPIVVALELSDLDALSQAQDHQRPCKLGDNATMDFILRYVFGIAPESIKTSADLLGMMLRLHYRNQQLPAILDQRLLQILRQSSNFAEWPLEQILTDRHAFFAFLQERWPVFLNEFALSNSKVREPATYSYDLKYAGPATLPFGDADIRIYISSMFGEGLLYPVEPPDSYAINESWAAVGVFSDPQANRLKRLNILLESVASSLPTIDSKYRDWLRFAYLWGELNALWFDDRSGKVSQELAASYQEIQATVDSNFLNWVESSYSGLHTQPAEPPVMVHHIPRALARRLESGELDRVALVVIDGLAIDQWVVIREVLRYRLPDLEIDESACFAWLPSITSISRQSIFAGKAPIYFPASIGTTDRESALWTQYWTQHGLDNKEISYLKIQEENELGMLSEVASNSYVKVLGIVVTKIDRIIHGMELGTTGMHNSIRQWANQEFLPRIIQLLKTNNFALFITSDHGNIEAEGLGCPLEGAIAEVRGERVRIYPDPALRSRVKERFPNAIEWPSVGLPENMAPLFAPGRFAFIKENRRTISHGGISVEELVVPLVRIK